MYDVVVVGAGPAGSAAARACAEAGLRTLCIEEHGTIGYPVQCAGLLSIAAFDECRVSTRSILNTVSGARFIPSAGEPLEIDAGSPRAHVVDRGILDSEMAAAAAEAGAEFRLKTSVVSLKGDRAITKGIHGREEIGFSILIAADGVRSTQLHVCWVSAGQNSSWEVSRQRCRAGQTHGSSRSIPMPLPSSSAG